MRYYGNKTKLLDFIYEAAIELDVSEKKSFFDVFTGTTAVGQHFKKAGYSVIANDWLYFSYALATTYIALNGEPQFKDVCASLKIKHEELFDYLNHLETTADFITRNYTPYESNPRQYFSVENGRRIDSIRITINNWRDRGLISETESCYLIAALLAAINRVSNISGTYGSYLKTWDPRALKTLSLEHPKVIKSTRKHLALNADAYEVVDKFNVDILYIDPPYNSRQYASNYFLPELIAEGWFGKTLPKIYGHTGMRPYEHQKSAFAMTNKAATALQHLIGKAKARYIFLSYNNEGIIPEDQILQILSKKGKVTIKSFEHKRYRSIGQDGTKVKTIEYLYVVKTGE